MLSRGKQGRGLGAWDGVSRPRGRGKRPGDLLEEAELVLVPLGLPDKIQTLVFNAILVMYLH